MPLNQDHRTTITDFFGETHQFVVIRPLGDGYLADVYLMQSLQDSTLVVVKILKTRHAEAERATEFLREADLLEQLAHRPEVVNPHPPGKGEILLEDNVRLPCTLQEYVTEPYRPLPELVEEGLSEPIGLVICHQFASLLSYIHSLGIVYADLKPEHIYWNGTQIKVIDWNVVKELSTAEHDVFQEAVAREIRAFGQTMYYLFTGRSTVKWASGPSLTTLISGNDADTHVDFADTTTDMALSLGTRLIIEQSLQENLESVYQSASELERALAQQVQRLRQPISREPITQTRAALSKGLAALEAADYEDAISYFEEAVFSTPGLITQSHLVTARIRQDERLPDSVKDQIEENLTLFRMAFQEGDLATALDALASSETILQHAGASTQAGSSEHWEVRILHELASQVTQAVQQAEEALQAGDYSAAQQLLQQASTLEPSAPFLQERLQTVNAFQIQLEAGEKSLQSHQFSEAAAAFQTLLDHMPQSASIEERWVAAKLGQGQIALEHNHFTEAQHAFKAVLERQPENKEALAGLAALESRRQRMQELEGWLTQARTAFQIGEYDEALRHINAVLELAPEHPEAHRLLDEVQQALQDQRARRVWQLLEKGHQAMANKAYAEAIQFFEQAATLDPDSEANILRARAEAAQARTEQLQALLHKAHAAFRGEDYETAVRYFEEAVDCCPEDLDARRGLTLARQRQAEVRAHEMRNLMAAGRGALSAGNYEQALQHFEKAATLGSDPEIASYIEKAFQIRDLVQSAQAAEAHGDLQAALEYYTRAQDIDPLPGLEGQVARIRAEVQAATRQRMQWLIEHAASHVEHAPEQAIAWLEQARDLEPDNEQVAELLLTATDHLRRRQLELRRSLDAGRAALQAGDASTAERAFARALELSPELAEARAGYDQAQQLQARLQAAQIANQRGDYEVAVAELEQALDIALDSPKIQQLWRHAKCEGLVQRACQAADESDHIRALELVNDALKLNPDHPRALELREVVQAEVEAARQAEEEAAQRALMARVATLVSTVDTHIEAGDYHAALQALEEAVELLPDDPELVRRRHTVMRQKARHDRARTLMNEARRFEANRHYDAAAEAYEIAAQLTPHAGLQTEAHARAAQARHKHRQQRWRHLLRRMLGLGMTEAAQTEVLGKDGT